MKNTLYFLLHTVLTTTTLTTNEKGKLLESTMFGMNVQLKDVEGDHTGEFTVFSDMGDAVERSTKQFKIEFVLYKDTVVSVDDKLFKLLNDTKITLDNVKFTCLASEYSLYVVDNDNAVLNKAAFKLIPETNKYVVHAQDQNYSILNTTNLIIPVVTTDMFNSAMKITNEQLQKLTNKNSMMFLFKQKGWKFCFDTFWHDEGENILLTALDHSNVFSFTSTIDAICVDVTDEEIKANTQKLSDHLSTKLSVNDYVELFEFYEKASFNKDLAEATEFCKLFRDFSETNKNEFLESKVADTEDTKSTKEMIKFRLAMDNGLYEKMKSLHKQSVFLDLNKIQIREWLEKFEATKKSFFQTYNQLNGKKYARGIESIFRNNMGNGFYSARIKLNELDRYDFHDKTGYIDKNKIKTYNIYSKDKIFSIQYNIKKLMTENILVIDKYRALHESLIELVKDIEAKKNGITDEGELKKINKFLVTTKVHLKYLKNILVYDKENITKIKNEIDFCKKHKFKSIKNNTKHLNILNEYKEDLQILIQFGYFTDPNESQKVENDLNDVIDLLEKNVLSLKSSRQKIEKIVLPQVVASETVEQINYDAYKFDTDSSEDAKAEEVKELLISQESMGFPEIVCIVCGILLFIVIFLLIASLIKIIRKRNIVVENAE